MINAIYTTLKNLFNKSIFASLVCELFDPKTTTTTFLPLTLTNHKLQFSSASQLALLSIPTLSLLVDIKTSSNQSQDCCFNFLLFSFSRKKIFGLLELMVNLFIWSFQFYSSKCEERTNNA